MVVNFRTTGFLLFLALFALMPPEGAPSDLFTVVAVGDILMGTTHPVEILPPRDGAELFESVKGFLRGDLVFGNLEGPLIDGGTASKCAKNGAVPRQHCFEFRMPARNARHLREAGFNALSIANNHSLDFGKEGLDSTINLVTTHGIQVVGGRYVAVFRFREKQVALVGFSHLHELPHSYSVHDLRRAREIVSRLRGYADHVIVSFHGGSEGEDAMEIPSGEETYRGERRGNAVAFARGVVEAGATLVLGHGPHVLRALEIYRGKLIAYSLGNFVGYGAMNTIGPRGLSYILQVRLDRDSGDFRGGRIVSVELGGRGIPRLEREQKALGLLKKLTASRPSEGRPRFSESGEILPPSD